MSKTFPLVPLRMKDPIEAKSIQHAIHTLTTISLKTTNQKEQNCRNELSSHNSWDTMREGN